MQLFGKVWQLRRCFMTGLIFIAGNIGAAVAQSVQPPLTQVIPPSPNMQAMQKYGDIPISAYTGIPNISIPLYTVKYHDISVPISLSYHASGIKVSEEASNVGLGWVLNAGGSVSRNIIGNDDFFGITNPLYANYFGVFNNFDFADGNYPANGNTYANGIVNFINSGTTTVTPYDISQNLPGAGSTGTLIEFQPDQFYYNVPGSNGKFILRRDSTRAPILQTPSNLKITYHNGGRVWDITSPEGFIYHFDQVETSRSSGEPTGNQHISAVYLTKITSPTGNVVTFSYAVDQANFIQTIGSWTETRNDVSYFESPPPEPFIYPATVPATASGGGGGQVYTSVYLSAIDYPTGRVLFNFSNDRTDTQSDKKLDSISVYTKDSQGNLGSKPVKTVDLSYGYFTGADNANGSAPYATSNYAKQRLRLDAVTIYGINNLQTHYEAPYKFSYYSPSQGPNKTSLSRDSWGYYNGSGKPTLLPTFIHTSSSDYIGYPDGTRYPNAGFMTDFTLSDIQYPTGGTTHFDYEPNDCDEQNSETHDNAGYTNTYSVIPSPNSYSDTWNNGQTADMKTLDITDIFSGFSSVNLISATFIFNTSPEPLSLNNIYVTLYDQNNNPVETLDAANSQASVKVLSGVTSINLTISLPGPGIYRVTATCNANYAANLQHIQLNGSWYTQVNSNPAASVTHPTMYSMAGGLRIKRVTDNDGINPPVVKRYIYHANVGQRLESSYGIRMSRPEYSYYEQGEDTYTITVTPPDGRVTYSNIATEHVMRLSDSNIPLNGSAQGNVVGYTQVTENYGENGENGKTVYQYYNQPDNMPPFVSNNYPRRRPYNSDIADPQNGELLEQTDYKNVNGQFIKVKDLTNTYIVDQTQQNSIFAVEDHPQLHDSFLDGSLTSQNYSPTSPQDRLLFTYTPMQAALTYQTIKVETDYNSDNAANYVQTPTNYYYDNLNNTHDYFPTRTVTTNSKNEIITAFTRYPNDFTNLTGSDAIAPGVKNLITNNMYSVPVEKYVQKTASDGSNLRIVSGSITGFAGTGLPLPQSVYEMETAIPLNNNNFSSYASSGTLNSVYQPALTFDKYDQTNGNLQQQHKQYDANNSYLWGYNNEYPIAQAVNASQNDIFFEGFEQGNGNSALNDAKTGHYSYSGSYSKGLTGLDNGTYTLSYWSKTGTAWALVVNTNITVNAGSYTISLSGQVDDVRFYPTVAQMSTYTYDPDIGVTSVSDPKCEITYYEYDGLGRLQNIKDKDGNIVKSFCYNYAGQAYGCTIPQTVYYNNPQSGVYNKDQSLCGTGYTGSPVTYTVPFGKYTSNISQADADQQAQADVTANGQNYANTYGTCIQQITFTITNHDVPYTYVFTVGTTTHTYSSLGTGSGLQITLPANTYSLNVFPTGGGSTPYNITLGNRPTVNTVSTTFTGVNISSGSSDLTILIN